MAINNKKFGWVDNPRAVEAVVATLPRPIFGIAAQNIAGSGAGKVALLHKCLEEVAGSFPIHNQTIGDCVSHGWGLGVDVLKCVEIKLAGENEVFRAETATEVIYAGSRVEIGRGEIGRGDGSLGAWAAKFVEDYGIVTREQHGGHDLRVYSGERAKQWGMPRAGVPDELEPEAREHPVKTVSVVRSYEEARDAIANGYPVPVCSMQGFSDQRDSEGFARPQGQWAHCMLFLAVDDEHRRPGLLCMNSWGPNWISGPKRHGQPDGSFWVDASTCTRMLRGGDSFAISNFAGYPGQNIPDFMFA